MGGGGGGGGGGGVGFGAAMSCFLLAALSSGFLLNEAPAAEGSSVGAFFMEVAGATADFTVGVFCTDGGGGGGGGGGGVVFSAVFIGALLSLPSEILSEASPENKTI